MVKIKVLLMLLVVFVLSNPLLSSAEVKKEFYPDGKLKSETYYKNGKLEGIAKIYDENGQLLDEENYKNGEAEGIRRGYYENGKLKLEINYKNGEVINKKDYDESGKLIN